MSNKPSNVDNWIKNRSKHQVKALEKASKIFDEKDSFTVNTLEAIYGQESSFGESLRARGITGAAGHFHIEKKTAIRFGMVVSKNNDQRFDVDDATYVASRYLKELDGFFRNVTNLGGGIKSIAVTNNDERKLFVIASYNAGEGRIAKAQKEAEKNGKNPQSWEDVKNYLIDAGATESKAEEIIKYVEKIIGYEKEFSTKSKANKELKDKKPSKKAINDEGYWVTLDDGKHVLIAKK
ncbi:MAG: transglycosylase SLT domain-containing protein [Rickettsiales bacterium]|nr:transglycosylase SLT domain-containing protein [Rickettsiales bacterium]